MTRIRFLFPVSLSLALLCLPALADWQGAAIGNPGDGQAGYHNPIPAGEGCDGGYDVGGAGRDIWDDRDGMYFMYQELPASGNFAASCRIQSFVNPGPGPDHQWGKAGMV